MPDDTNLRARNGTAWFSGRVSSCGTLWYPNRVQRSTSWSRAAAARHRASARECPSATALIVRVMQSSWSMVIRKRKIFEDIYFLVAWTRAAGRSGSAGNS
jgi:hypothetical protein